jgi:4'-phosphopantetheinyl transferase
MEKIAQRFFTREEAEHMRNSKESDQVIAFLKIWTAKESHIKYTGKGLSQNLSTFSVFTINPRITTISMGGKLIYSYTSEDEKSISSIVKLNP